MFFNIRKKICYVLVAFGFVCSAYADTSFNLSTAISQVQANNIITGIESNAGAPSGTEVSNTSTTGSYTLNTQNILTAVSIDALNFTVKVPILFFTITDDVHIQLTADIPNGDCSKPANVHVTETGDESTADGQIQGYLNGHSSELVKNYFIKMTDLVKYCAIQPQLQYSVQFY